MSDKFDQQTAVLLPCICLPDYKDRNLTQPDCPRCNYGDDIAEALRKVGEAEYARGIAAARILVICPDCERNNHAHTEGQVGHLICDCGCWWLIKQRVLYAIKPEEGKG